MSEIEPMDCFVLGSIKYVSSKLQLSPVVVKNVILEWETLRAEKLPIFVEEINK